VGPSLARPRPRSGLAIAACALTWDARLWTLNVVDFRDIPALVVERPR
jgi:predicted nucleic acid-binding protein